MVDELRGTGQQANHLNQNAAYKGIIPEEDGLSHALRGDAFKDRGTPHYEFHRSLEQFWDQFRRRRGVEGPRFNQKPTNAEFGQALQRSLEAAGLSPVEAAELAARARAQRLAYGLLDDMPVPNVPRPINQR